MAYDRKPSIHTSRSTIGSAEELDAYGVWVKSEPQDFSAAFAGAGPFDGGDMSFGADINQGFNQDFDSGYNPGFNDFGMAGMADVGPETKNINADDFFPGNFDDVPDSGADDSRNFQDDMSTKLLMKIADEISSIRSELTTLKREFEDIRTESGSLNGGEDSSESDKGGGFFAGGENAKSTLTDDEMSDMLNTADFTDDLAFDPLREEDEAALRSLSEQTEPSPVDAAADAGADGAEEIEIDYKNLDINPEEFEIKADTEVQTDQTLSEDAAASETGALGAGEATDGFPGDFTDSSYLEEDPFASVDAGFEDMTIGEIALDENALNNVLGESDFDFSLEGLSVDPVAVPEESSAETPSVTESLSDSIDLNDDIFSETGGFNINLDTGTDDSGIALVIPEAFETEAEEAAIPFDDDLEGFAEDELTETIEELSETIDELPVLETAAPEPVVHEPAGLESADMEIPLPELEAVDSGDQKEIGKTVSDDSTEIPPGMKNELKNILTYMDHLLESLPEEKIEEFARSDHFDAYKKLFKDLGIA